MPTRLLLIVIIIVCSLVGCDRWAALLPQPVAVTPTPAAGPRIQVEVEPPVVTVGETVTVHFQALALGIPQFTFTLEPGVSLMVRHGSGDRVVLTPEPADAPFVIESSNESLASGLLTLRAVRPGTATLTIAASGEGGLPGGPFFWTSVNSEPLRLEALPAPG